jgi:hypothetical protein
LVLTDLPHQASHGDYLSRIAWRTGIPLEQFLLDNLKAKTINNFDTPLAGLTLMVCNPTSGIKTITETVLGWWCSKKVVHIQLHSGFQT